jgi:hypothetical protein
LVVNYLPGLALKLHVIWELQFESLLEVRRVACKLASFTLFPKVAAGEVCDEWISEGTEVQLSGILSSKAQILKVVEEKKEQFQLTK